MIAALYVQTGGVYFGLPNVDPWDVGRDARTYAGPHPVVAHPPCERWGRYWFGGPSWKGPRKIKGDDGGCFAAALAAVRQWGGVIEHPAASAAWTAFSLNRPPAAGGWVAADWLGGWTCHVEQGHYGHRARKATWLYAYGIELPSLCWSRAPGVFLRLDDDFHSAAERKRAKAEVAWSYECRPNRRRSRTGICQQLSHKERSATPIPFRDLLIGMAESENRARQTA